MSARQLVQEMADLLAKSVIIMNAVRSDLKGGVITASTQRALDIYLTRACELLGVPDVIAEDDNVMRCLCHQCGNELLRYDLQTMEPGEVMIRVKGEDSSKLVGPCPHCGQSTGWEAADDSAHHH